MALGYLLYCVQVSPAEPENKTSLSVFQKVDLLKITCVITTYDIERQSLPTVTKPPAGLINKPI